MSTLVATAMIAAVNDEDNMYFGEGYYMMELYSHANMALLGRHALIISNIGHKLGVSPFTPDFEELLKVPIFYAAIS